jgi:hypothetical protein
MTIRHVSASGISLLLHLIAALIVTWLPWGTRSSFQPVATSATAVFAPSVEASTGDPSGGAAPDVPAAPEDSSGAALLQVPSSEVSVGGFRFDFGKINHRSKLLFPFLTRPLPLDLYPRPVEQGGSGPLVSPFAPAAEPARSRKPPLAIADVAMQDVIDKAWARRERWADFQPIVALATAHHPDEGRLPELLQAYTEQNLLQPYVDPAIRDPRLWTMLAVASDSVNFIAFINAYVKANPGTRASIELMFLLDEVAQGNHDGLATLLDTDVETDLWWTRQASRVAYDLIAEIQRFYRGQLAMRGVASAAALRSYYDEVRLAILTQIVRAAPGGYRASDARFLIGGVHWRQGRTAAAVRWWREMTVDPDDTYVTAYRDLLDVLNATDPSLDPVAKTRVDGILASEYRRWLDTSTSRLRYFGYEADEF